MGRVEGMRDNAHGGVGTMSATMGLESWTIDLDEGIKSGLPLNRFGMFQVGAAGGTLSTYFDDLTFTSMVPVPDASLAWMTLAVSTSALNGSRLMLKGCPVTQPTTTHRGSANSAICTARRRM